MDINSLISSMTLEEKAGLCSGKDFWHTKAVERLGIPEVMLSDGPHGLRKQSSEGDHLGINDSIKAVCFPAACATAASFDRDLIRKMGEAIGDECQAEKVSVVLGPAANIKRSPLCGRNFEYFSEDPYLATEMAANHIKGIQSKNVGTSLKHFFANNQENRRMSSDSVVDERTMREIYLAAFEGAVTEGKPWTVMCSYNKVNGTYMSENPLYLNDLLRGEWGFEGYVVTDWGAVDDRVAGIIAGLDLEMPSSGGLNDALIVKAVKEGRLDEAVLDKAVRRILNIIFRFTEHQRPDAIFEYEAHHELARRIETESIVLLKNEGLLPLDKSEKLAFIGGFAKKPRYQGGGSSHINSFRIESVLDATKGMGNITYAEGFSADKDITDEALMAEAVEAAKAARAAVIFAGLPDSFESEGYDRTHMSLPDCQNRLISEIIKVQPNTVVVLHNGSPVELPWADDVKAILEVYLGGQAVGAAAADVLFGDVNPSGRLPETFPIKLSDNPSYLFFPGEKDNSEYREGVFVGYRYYDKKDMKVRFPFGHGLSYTTFEYTNLAVVPDRIKDTDSLLVSVDVTNTGNRAGKEVVQLYVADKESTFMRPLKELKGFEKISLEPGETKTVRFVLGKRAFAYYNVEIKDWHVESGEFEILIGRSSRDIVCSKGIYVESTVEIPVKYTMSSTFGDIMSNPRARAIVEPMMKSNPLFGKPPEEKHDDSTAEAVSADMLAAMMKDMPIKSLLSFGFGQITPEDIERLLAALNAV